MRYLCHFLWITSISSLLLALLFGINAKPKRLVLVWSEKQPWVPSERLGVFSIRCEEHWGGVRSENPFLIGCILFPGGLWSTFLVRQLFFFDGRGFYGEESTLHLQKISSEWRVEIHASNDLTFKRFRFWIKILFLEFETNSQVTWHLYFYFQTNTSFIF